MTASTSVKQTGNFIREVFWFVVFTLVGPPLAGCAILVDVIRRPRTRWWIGVVVGTVLIVLTLATVAGILLGFARGVVPWWIALALAICYLVTGGCLAWIARKNP